MQLVVGHGERKQCVAAVRVLGEPERERAGRGAVEPLPYHARAGTEQGVGVQILRMDDQRVEHGGGLSRVAALSVQGRERRRRVELTRIGREALLQGVDRGGERGGERARVGSELLHCRGQRSPLARHRLGPRRRIAREQFLVRRRELRVPRLARLGGGHEARQHGGVAGDPPPDGIEARAHARGPLRGGMALHLAHHQVPGVGQGLPPVVREGRGVAGGASREAVVGECRIVVRPAGIQSGHGGECLGIAGIQAGSDL